MELKKVIKVFLSLSIILFVFGCSNPGVNSGSDTVNVASEEVEADKEILARFIAESRLNNEKNSEEPEWSDDAKITKAYPIYTPGVDGVSYYEFKIEDNSTDAGYILVSTTKNDIPVPEMASTGLTLTEQYINITGVSDLNVIRFDFVKSAAESTEATSRSGETKVLALTGFNNQGTRLVSGESRSGESDPVSEYKELKESYAKETIENECLPFYNKDKIDEHYKMIEEYNSGTRGGGGGSSLPSVKESKTYLDSYFEAWRTPMWWQHTMGNGHLVGCGPAAWAVVYAYWKERKGKSRLFGGEALNDNHTKVSEKAMEKIFRYCDTVNGYTIDRKSYGLTWPYKMPNAAKYGAEYGYTTTIDVHTIGGDWTGGMNWAYKTVKSDKPLVLYFWANGGHYGVVEGVKKRYWSNTGWATELGLRVNFVWSIEVRKWVYAFSDTFKSTTSCYEVYAVTKMN